MTINLRRVLAADDRDECLQLYSMGTDIDDLVSRYGRPREHILALINRFGDENIGDGDPLLRQLIKEHGHDDHARRNAR